VPPESLPIFVAPRNDLMPGKPVVNGSAEAIIPGVGGESLYLLNTGLVEIKVYITASLGYQAGVSSAPVTVLKPVSVGLLSQLISVYLNPGASVAPIHPHVQDGWILVAIMGRDVSFNWTTLTVTAAGKTGVLVRRMQNGGVTAEEWMIQDVPQGQQSVTCTFSAAGIDGVCIATFSLDPAVGIGNSGSLGWNPDAAQNVSIENIEDRSAALWFVASGIVTVLETSNAEKIFSPQIVVGPAVSQAHCWRRKGQGTASFVLDGQGIGQHASVGIELRLSS